MFIGFHRIPRFGSKIKVSKVNLTSGVTSDVSSGVSADEVSAEQVLAEDDPTDELDDFRFSLALAFAATEATLVSLSRIGDRSQTKQVHF